MKNFRLVMKSIFFLIVLATVGSFAEGINVADFMASPIPYIAENFNPIGLSMATFPYAAVLWADGSPNMGGTTNRAYFIPLSGIDAFPALPVSPATAAEYHTITGAFTLVDGANVVELYTTYKTGSLKSDPEGEIDGKYFKLSPEFFHPGSKAEIINFATNCINTPGVLFLPTETGKYLVVGSPGHPVYLTPAFDLGKVGEGRKGTMFTGEAYSQLMLTKYEGTLPLTPNS